MEQFDSLGPNIAENMLGGYYKAESRGTFIGIKTEKAAQNRVTVLIAISRRLTRMRRWDCVVQYRVPLNALERLT